MVVLSQFTDADNRPTLGRYISQPGVYPAGRLDFHSEGLLLLTDDGKLQHKIAHPNHKLPKTYWIQVEGAITDGDLKLLRKGIELRDGLTLPARARRIPNPEIWSREPPIRYRENIPTRWIEIRIIEGRNRQLRRMTAAIGFPTLRLVRIAIGHWHLGKLVPGEYKAIQVNPKSYGRDGKAHCEPAPS